MTAGHDFDPSDFDPSYLIEPQPDTRQAFEATLESLPAPTQISDYAYTSFDSYTHKLSVRLSVVRYHNLARDELTNNASVIVQVGDEQDVSTQEITASYNFEQGQAGYAGHLLVKNAMLLSFNSELSLLPSDEAAWAKQAWSAMDSSDNERYNECRALIDISPDTDNISRRQERGGYYVFADGTEVELTFMLPFETPEDVPAAEVALGFSLFVKSPDDVSYYYNSPTTDFAEHLDVIADSSEIHPRVPGKDATEQEVTAYIAAERASAAKRSLAYRNSTRTTTDGDLRRMTTVIKAAIESGLKPAA